MIVEICKSIFFNHIYDKFKEFKFKYEKIQSEIYSQSNSKISLKPKYEVKSIKFNTKIFSLNDIENILSFVEQPVFHFIIDDTPCAYFSVAAVIESRLTNEWYVIGSGEFAFQGTGGGYRRSLKVKDLLQKHNINFALWCTTRKLLSQLERGKVSWLLLKPKLIPFLSIRNIDDQWQVVTARVKELFPRLNIS
ncbi:hypothetical protein BN1013_01776 [Candidatus Rubidus massiliensis]|nr:hypothetical protein BN1013_01776 [Candidatus Rubidus massiliensis]